jgi:O-antigen/teichoic acid export membrane protein
VISTNGHDPEAGAGTGSGSMVATAVRGVSWSFLGAVGQAALQMGAIVLLARLLSVEQFGLAASASLVMSFAVMASQFGVGPALVQSRRLDRTDVASAFVLSTALGLLMAGGLIALSPIIGRLVGLPPDATYLLRLLAIVVVVGGLSAVSTGLLQRQMRFRALAIIDLLSFGVGYLGTAGTLASLGLGAASLVWGQIVQSVTMAIGYYALALHDVRPRRLSVMVQRGKTLARFGSAFSLSQFGNWLAVNGDNLTVASLLGPAPLGIYSRAYQLLVQPANLIGSVADRVLFPAMSRIQDDNNRLARAYVTVNTLVALVTLPVSALLFVLAPEVVAVLLGPGWSAVVAPLQIFSVVLLPRTAYKISGSLTRATGAMLGGALRQWIYACEVLIGAGVGSRWGVVGVAVGASVAILLHHAAMLKFSARVQAGLVGAVLRAYGRALVPTAGTAAVASPVALALRGTAPAYVVVLAAAGAGVLGAGLVLLLTWRRLFAEEFAMLRHVRRREGPRPPTATPAGLTESAQALP